MASKNIMIVDDEATIRQLISLILRSEGYSVVEAEHGKDALSKMANTEIDMLITDLRMPMMDGLSLTKELRKSPAYLSLPIVMLTTGFDGYRKTEAEQAGVSDRVRKSLIYQNLMDTVKRYSV